jgi:hypothetical protein
MTSSSNSKSGSRYCRLFIVLAFLGLIFLLFVHSARFVNSQAPATNSNSHRARVSPSPPSPPPCPAPTLQTIYAPTIGLPEIANGRIVFNSRVDSATDVQLTFYTEEGFAVAGPVVQIQPAEIHYLELASLIPRADRWRVRWGGISLSYSGKVFDIWAQITLLGALNSGSSDVTFSVLNGRGSDTQEAVWWMPRAGRAVIALGNSSDTSIHTQLDFSDRDSQAVDIAPHATEYVRLHPGGRNHSRGSNDGMGESLRLTTVGPAGSLKIAGLVLASDSRLVSSIRFYDTKSMVQQHLFATNMPLRGSQPHILLSNTSDATVVARPRFRPSSGESGAPVELPSLTLQPQEIAELDLNLLLAAAVGRKDLDNVSVEVLNSGTPGSLIGTVVGTGQGARETFDLPLRDSGINRMNGGAYPWRIDGDFTTVASVTNVGDTTSRFIAEVYYPGGTHLFGHRDLAVGETAFFDLKKIRDQQIPDANGKVLPQNVSIGQFRWHWYPGPNAPHMIGRAAMVSESNGISASYSCMPNCGAHGPEYIITGNTTVLSGAYQTMHTQERWYGASGGYSDLNTDLYASTVDNTSVASLSNVSTGWLNVNGFSPGNTYWWWDYWYGFEYDDGFDCRYQQDLFTGSEPADVTGATVASIQYQTSSGYVTVSGTLYVLKGTSVTFKAVPNPANGQFASGKPVWSGSSGASGTGQTTSVSFNTASSSTSNFKTVIATAGNSVTANIIVFDLTGVLTPDDNFSGRSTTRFGIHEHITLGLSITPSGITATQVGGLRWQQNSGSGTLLDATTNGTGSYNVADSPGSATLQLKLLGGPSTGQGPTKGITVVAPSGGYETGTNTWHVQYYWSVGFCGLIHIQPTDVSFLNIVFKEDDVGAGASGWLGFLNGVGHSPGASSVITSGFSGSTVYFPDQVRTGAYGGPGATYGAGTVSWAIPWKYAVQGGSYHQFATATQAADSDATGRARISKAGSGIFEKAVSALGSGSACN